MPLTPIQLQAVPVLDWLFDQQGHRREGRSLVIAVGLIRQALRYPGSNIRYVDHYPERNQSDVIRNYITELIDVPALARWDWSFQRDSFRLIAPEITDAIPHDWLPTLPQTPDMPVTRKSVWERLVEDDLVY